MTRKEIAFWFIAGVVLAIVFLPMPARAQGKSETVQQLEVLRDIIASQSRSIEALAAALAKQQQPVFVGGMPLQQPAPQQVAEEKPCADSLIGCALRGFGSILLKAGGAGISFLDRNAVPLLQVAATDRAARRQAEASIAQAEFAYMERRDVANAHSAAVTGLGVNLQNVATTGFNVFAGLPPQTVNNISGTGINFGNGTLTYSPVSGSYNPVNPTARVCGWVGTGTTATFVCQ